MVAEQRVSLIASHNYHALGYAVPRFLHLPLAVDEGGERLAKRSGAVGLEPLRAAGLSAAAVAGALAASVGLAPAGTEATTHELLAVFDPAHLAREPSTIPKGGV